MHRWAGKTAVVTGGSSGIGADICVGLANAGFIVVGLARRAHLIEELCSQVRGGGCIHAKRCDITNTLELRATFKWIDETFGSIHVLVNNAGVFHPGQITDVADGQISDANIHAMIDTNTKATILCSRLAVSSMTKYSFDGHIININSAIGHYVPTMLMLNVLSATKYAVTAFTASLSNELSQLNSKIKVTSISPGLVNTPMTTKEDSPSLWTSDIVDAIVFVLSTPPTVNVSELTVTPVGGKIL